ncbi:phosphatase PAP2 family protein [Mucilaginibacter sp. UR6-1]|uniref:phosphatase PAP2 family protein n=1 Tax=Mucilaginibacter sp. UR6-1 TaxID=1435643 RepID=UPI001E4B858F|nr:phosphatase PAP2 family protein [Mucilaginibacter sp. UR6-1]MCC8407542.1 phosphatase PAP2 family protein [Mucilaginibacter sp. UR6-1]
MKKLFTYASLILLASSIAACNKDIKEYNEDFPALQPAKVDATAGNWKPLVITSTEEFNLPAPEATSSAAYQKELDDLKALSSNLTSDQREIINYWKVGSVLRWNEIMRELVAKHNLPPYQNPDGTYPIPSAANPFSYPQFPFSNPPYAARAYAYVSAAQYDALVAAWHFKYKYNRQAPYKTASGITVSVPKSDLPSYPSEDAVVAGASFEIMKLLFPADIDYIKQKAEEEKQYRMLAGVNVASDVIAGDSLGRWVARKVVARAKTDGMGAAVGNATVWKKLEDDCIAKGETPWYSLEIPKRPPMLPVFGNVKPMMFAAADVASIRPPAPPATNSEIMKKEVAEVLDFTKNASRERMRIVNYWADGVGTYTPPGHWNAIATTEFVKNQYSEVRWARNYALLNASLMDAAIVCWNTKYYYFNARPCQLDGRIKTLTGVPNFPAYISGHSTFSGAAATILAFLVPSKAKDFEDMANEASMSRMYGGIHYRSDCSEGLITGQKVGNYAVERAKIDGAN